MVPPFAYAPRAADLERPKHLIEIHSRAMEYRRGVIVREWRWFCSCGAVGAWQATWSGAMTDGDRHLTEAV